MNDLSSDLPVAYPCIRAKQLRFSEAPPRRPATGALRLVATTTSAGTSWGDKLSRRHISRPYPNPPPSLWEWSAILGWKALERRAFRRNTPAEMIQWAASDLTRPLFVRNSAKHPYCLLHCAAGRGDNVEVYTVKPDRDETNACATLPPIVRLRRNVRGL